MNVMDIFTLLGGLGLFLFGMKLMGEGLEKAAGARLKRLLEYVTSNRLLAVLVGFLITGIIQSSSATTVMTVGFVNAGLISLSQSVGIIMGANIGTTVTSLLLSIKLDFGVIFACAGMGLVYFGHKRTYKQAGQILMGLGILFVGMNTMSNAMIPLREWGGFHSLIIGISNPLVGILAGAGITAILQSSSASVGILQVLASQGLVPFHIAIFVLFGQNIGTCVTAMIASTGTSHTAKRAALVHLVFNILGTAIFILIALLTPFSSWIESLAPDNIRLQIALTHIVFNITTTLILLPMAGMLEKLSWLLERRQDPEREPMTLRYYDPRLLSTPPIAAAQLMHEVVRMTRLAARNYTVSVECFRKYSTDLRVEINANETVIDYLNQEITRCLVDVMSQELPHKEARMIGSLFHVVNDLERIADHSMNIAEGAEIKEQEHIEYSTKASQGLDSLISKVDDILSLALDTFSKQSTNIDTLLHIDEIEKEIDLLTETLRENHIDRLKNKKCSVKSGMNYTEMLVNLERIADHSVNIAHSVT